jgi:alpha-amylase
MKVTDAVYGVTIVNAVRSGMLNASALERYSVNIDPKDIITWVESHDTFCNAGETSDLTEKQILYGWAILSGRNDSTPLYLSRPAGSSPGINNRWGNNIIGEVGNDAFKSKEVAALNHFKTAMQGTSEHFSNPTDNNSILMIERGNSGAILINTGTLTQLSDVTAFLLADGDYEDLISGNVFSVNNGLLSGSINAESVVVFYKEDGPRTPAAPWIKDNINDTPNTNNESLVFFVNEDGWEEVYCYVYSTSFEDGVIENASWPGVPMTLLEGDLYVYELPDWDIFNVMFNNNAGIQFPPANAPGLRMTSGERMILDGVILIPFEPPFRVP